MKLKYYLRTLGIGIFVTAVILTVSSGLHKMTDEQVIQRAKELGMVEAKNQVLSDLREEQSKKPSEENMEQSEAETSVESSGDKKEGGENETTSTEMTQDNSLDESEASEEEQTMTSEPEQPETGEPEPTEALETESAVPSEAEQPGTPEMVEIVIVRGDSSVSVSQKLYNAGLVSSAAEYDRYLCRNKFDYNISVGTYQIPVGSTEEQIAKIITRK